MHRDSLWELLQRCLFALGVLASVLVFFYAFENWRGRNAWKRFAREMASRGESLNWRDFARKSVPDDQNFMAAPVLNAIAYKDQIDTVVWNKIQDNPLSSYSFDPTVWQNGEALDLSDARAFLKKDAGQTATNRTAAAEEILQALSSLNPEFQELRQARLRPFSQFRGNGNPDGRTPNSAGLRALAYLLALRASAELALGGTEEAFADACVIERLSAALVAEQNLVSVMMGSAMLASMGVQTFWEGLAAGQWSEDQIGQFQSRFASVNLLRALDGALRGGERAGINYVMDQHSTAGLHELFGSSAPGPGLRPWAEALYYKAWPRGWVLQNQVVHNRLLTETAFSGYSVAKQQVYPEKCRENIAALMEALNSKSPFTHLAEAGIPNFKRATETVARHQTFVNEAALACVLDLFRREHQEYPTTLDALLPCYPGALPHDLITGEPLRYRRPNPTTYLLYSVGWDESDDGGRTNRLSNTAQVPGPAERGDWVWPLPELSATSR